MALVQLSDIIDVTVFQDLPSVNSPEKTAFFESGVVAPSALLASLATAPGALAELPFWKDLAATDEPNLSSDVAGNSATPKNFVQGEQISRKAMLNQGWSAADLAVELAMGPKAMDHLRARVDTYWNRQLQRRLIASCVGVLADNVASDGGDMVYVAAGTTNGDRTASTVFSRENFTAAAFTMGDAVDGIGAIAVHAIVYKRMVDNNDIVFIRQSEGDLGVPTFLGRRVIVDDNLPYTAAAGTGDGDAAARYTSVLFGAGAFGFGDGMPTVPVEVSRDAEKGDGGGVETLWTRKTWILHPFGYQNTGAPSGKSFSLAELADATTWARVVDRKSVPMAFLVTNG